MTVILSSGGRLRQCMNFPKPPCRTTEAKYQSDSTRGKLSTVTGTAGTADAPACAHAACAAAPRHSAASGRSETFFMFVLLQDDLAAEIGPGLRARQVALFDDAALDLKGGCQ